jgi:T-complex protein 1 subunit alpha
MKKRIVNAKIACLDINLQKARMQLGIQILVDDPDQLEDIRKRYVYAIPTIYMSCSNSPSLAKLKSP